MVPRAKAILALLAKERTMGLPQEHVLHGSTTYNSWLSMHSRVRNDPAYMGMPVEDAWYNFFSFLADLGEAPSPTHTLDRIEGEKGYVKGNVRWADKTVQTRNRSNTVYLTIGEVTKPMAEWCEIHQVNYETAKKRYQRGWGHEEVIHGRRKKVSQV